MGNKEKMGRTRDALDESKIMFCHGCFCTITGLMCEDCIGCMSDSEFLCLRRQLCCKSGVEGLMCTPNDGDCCQIGLYCCAYSCKNPTTCCKEEGQCCCVANLCAFPCTDDVPCPFGCYGLSLYPAVGCCLKLSEFGVAKQADAGAAEPGNAA